MHPMLLGLLWVGIILTIVGVFFLIKSCVMSFEMDDGEVYLVKRNGRPMSEFSNATSREILNDFSTHGVRLACAQDVVRARAQGASWPYGGWLASGQSVKLDSRRGYCPGGLMCSEYLSRRYPELKGGFEHLQTFQHRLNDGVIVDEQAVGYLLYGRKPAVNDIPNGYTVFGAVVPDENNASYVGEGVWFSKDITHAKDSKVFTVVVEGDDAYREHADARSHQVMTALNKLGHVVSRASYDDVVRAAAKDVAESPVAGWTVDLELVEMCNGLVKLNNPKNKLTGYVMIGDRPNEPINGFRIF